MHEWALAEAILKSAKQVAEKEKLKKLRKSPLKSVNFNRLNHRFCVLLSNK